jgi:ADP-L-glycero-D-manno-heptose 6-epimerase
MIIVTGAYGFIGSCLCAYLRHKGHQDIVAVDDFSPPHKAANNVALAGMKRVERATFQGFIERNRSKIEVIFHLGARTDTTEQDENLLEELNTSYSKMVWEKCASYHIPLIYASSAATYGMGINGYVDNHALVPRLEPLNPYGWSKQLFDLWALNQGHQPPRWYGLKFFNVYGPNEGHKGRMASVIFHAFKQISEQGSMKLFRSHHPDYPDGGQSRDFIYVKDVLEVMYWLYESREVKSGLYNVGTGQARTFEDLTLATFNAMGVDSLINYIDTPEDIRDNYQYFTEANMDKIRKQGYNKAFTPLEVGVEDYVKNYLMKELGYK